MLNKLIETRLLINRINFLRIERRWNGFSS